MPADRSLVDAELDRVGASYGKAGAANCISTMFGSDERGVQAPLSRFCGGQEGSGSLPRMARAMEGAER